MRKAIPGQGGASTLTTLLVLICGALLLIFAVKLIPIYVDDYTVQGMLENLENDEDVRGMTDRKLRESIQRRMSVNNVENFDAKDIRIERDGQRVTLAVDYEVRTALFQNIDAVVHFEHHYEWIAPQ